MKSKLYWGLATLIILIIGAGVFSMIQIGKQDTEPNIIYKAPSQEVLDNLPKTEVVEVAEVDNRKPPADASPTGHWHGDEWHEEAHNTPIEVSEAEVSIPIHDTGDVKQSWAEWSKIKREISRELSLASKEVLEAMPQTEEELERFKTSPKKQRKYNVALAKMAKIDKKLIEFEKKNPLLQ